MVTKVTEERIELTAVDKFSRVLGQAEGQFKQLGSTVDTVRNAVVALAAAAGGTQLAAMYMDVMKATAALDDMAEQTGATVEGLSKIQSVAKIGGHDFNSVSDAMGKMVKGLKGADEEGQNASHALEFLGVKAKDVNGRFRDSAEILQDVAKALAKYEDGGNKVALVQDILGKGGARYLSLLKDMAEEGSIAARVTAEQAAEAEKFEKNLNRLKLAAEDSKRAFANDLTPSVLGFTEQLVAAQQAGFGLLSALTQISVWRVTGRSASEQIISIDAEIERQRRGIEMMQRAGESWNTIQPNLGRIGNLHEQRKAMRSIEAQQAVAKYSGAEFLDARDIKLRTPQSLYYQTPDKPKQRGDEGESLLMSLQDQLQASRGQASVFDTTVRKLTEGVKQYSFEVQGAALAMAAEIDMEKRAAEHSKIYLAYVEAKVKAEEELAEKRTTAVAGWNARIRQMEFENELIESSASATNRVFMSKQDALQAEIELTTVREKAIAFRQIDLEAQRATIDQTEEETAKIYAMAAAKKAELGILIDAKVAREKSRDAAQAAAQEWKDNFKRVSDDIERALTQGIVDSLMNGFKKGESITDNFIRTLKSAFASAVLTPTISAMVRPVAQGMTGMMASAMPGLFGSGGGVGGIGPFINGGGIGGGQGGFGGLGNLFQGASTAYNAATGQGIFGLLGGGAVAGGGFGAGLGSIGAGALADISLGGLGGTLGAEALGASAAGFGGLGAGLAAIPGWGWAALGAGLLLGGGDLFGGGGGPKMGEILLQRQGGRNHRDTNPNSSGRSFVIGNNNLPGSEANEPFLHSFIADLNDPSKYDPDALNQFVGTSISGMNPQEMVQQLLQKIAPASQAAGQKSTTKSGLAAALDPMGYWSSQIAELGSALGSSAETLADWRVEFLAALDGPLSQDGLNKWQRLGEAIQNAANVAGQAASQISPNSFRTLVDYTRAVRTAGAVPKFADGGWHSGGLAVVGENGPELMDLPAGRIYNNSDSRRMSDSSGVAAEIAMLRHEVRAVALYAARTAKVLDKFETNGTPVRALDPSQRIAVTLT